MKITQGPNDFYRVEGASGRALKWIRYTIPNRLRYFDPDEKVWFVYKSHIDDVKQLGSTGPTATIPSVSDDYALLHLRRGAPMVIVEAVWRTLAKLHHPDKGGDEETFKRLSAAYHRIRSELDE